MLSSEAFHCLCSRNYQLSSSRHSPAHLPSVHNQTTISTATLQYNRLAHIHLRSRGLTNVLFYKEQQGLLKAHQGPDNNEPRIKVLPLHPPQPLATLNLEPSVCWCCSGLGQNGDVSRGLGHATSHVHLFVPCMAEAQASRRNLESNAVHYRKDCGA